MLDRVLEIGAALADPTRISVLVTVARCPECTVGEVARSLGYAVSTVSHHVRRLRVAGLVEVRRRGPRTLLLARVDRWGRIVAACAS